MSTRRLGNIIKRKLFFKIKSISFGEEQRVKNQFRDLSRLGGNLIVMRMGN